jgi:MFS family permease
MSLLDYLKARRTSKQGDDLARQTSRDSARAFRSGQGKKRAVRFPNPLHVLSVIAEKDVGLILFQNCLVYTAFFDVIASAPYLFQQIYGYNDLKIGLCFLAYGTGGFIAPIVTGRCMDWNYRRVARKIGFSIDRRRGDDLAKFPLELARIQVAFPFLVVGNVALLLYGWILQIEASVAVPLVLQFLMGLFLTGGFNVMSIMLVDLYPESPSTATAANNLVRCLVGAGGTATIIIMIDAMGRGWAFTFLSLVVFATTPVFWVLIKWGPGWREERRFRVMKKKRQQGEELKQ